MGRRRGVGAAPPPSRSQPKPQPQKRKEKATQRGGATPAAATQPVSGALGTSRGVGMAQSGVVGPLAQAAPVRPEQDGRQLSPSTPVFRANDSERGSIVFVEDCSHLSALASEARHGGEPFVFSDESEVPRDSILFRIVSPHDSVKEVEEPGDQSMMDSHGLDVEHELGDRDVPTPRGQRPPPGSNAAVRSVPPLPIQPPPAKLSMRAAQRSARARSSTPDGRPVVPVTPRSRQPATPLGDSGTAGQSHGLAAGSAVARQPAAGQRALPPGRPAAATANGSLSCLVAPVGDDDLEETDLFSSLGGEQHHGAHAANPAMMPQGGHEVEKAPVIDLTDAVVTSHRKEFHHELWPDVLRTSRDAVERTLLSEISSATEIHPGHIRIVQVKPTEETHTISALFDVVHSQAVSEAELNAELAAFTFPSMQLLVDLRAKQGSEEEQPKSGLLALLENMQAVENMKKKKKKDDDNDHNSHQQDSRAAAAASHDVTPVEAAHGEEAVAESSLFGDSPIEEWDDGAAPPVAPVCGVDAQVAVSPLGGDGGDAAAQQRAALEAEELPVASFYKMVGPSLLLILFEEEGKPQRQMELFYEGSPSHIKGYYVKRWVSEYAQCSKELLTVTMAGKPFEDAATGADVGLLNGSIVTVVSAEVREAPHAAPAKATPPAAAARTNSDPTSTSKRRTKAKQLTPQSSGTSAVPPEKSSLAARHVSKEGSWAPSTGSQPRRPHPPSAAHAVRPKLHHAAPSSKRGRNGSTPAAASSPRITSGRPPRLQLGELNRSPSPQRRTTPGRGLVYDRPTKSSSAKRATTPRQSESAGSHPAPRRATSAATSSTHRRRRSPSAPRQTPPYQSLTVAASAKRTPRYHRQESGGPAAVSTRRNSPVHNPAPLSRHSVSTPMVGDATAARTPSRRLSRAPTSPHYHRVTSPSRVSAPPLVTATTPRFASAKALAYLQMHRIVRPSHHAAYDTGIPSTVASPRSPKTPHSAATYRRWKSVQSLSSQKVEIPPQYVEKVLSPTWAHRRSAPPPQRAPVEPLSGDYLIAASGGSAAAATADGSEEAEPHDDGTPSQQCLQAAGGLQKSGSAVHGPLDTPSVSHRSHSPHHSPRRSPWRINVSSVKRGGDLEGFDLYGGGRKVAPAGPTRIMAGSPTATATIPALAVSPKQQHLEEWHRQQQHGSSSRGGTAGADDELPEARANVPVPLLYGDNGSHAAAHEGLNDHPGDDGDSVDDGPENRFYDGANHISAAVYTNGVATGYVDDVDGSDEVPC